MKTINELLNKNGLKVKKYTIKGKATIVDTPLGSFVFKAARNKNIYKYLSSRNFEYFPKVIDSNGNEIMYEYLDNIDYDNSQKAFDIMHLISLLHSKTTFYKEIDYDEYKNLYEDLNNKIDYINNYYLDVISQIESRKYMSPSEYLIARNISKISSCIYYCKNELNHWFELVKDKKRKRVVTLHNNLDLDHLIKNKSSYLISWDKSKIDLPIYDLVDFYNKYSLEFDFSALFDEYQRIFPLLEEEKVLLNILISIPKKIIFNHNEFEMVKNTRKMLDKIFKTEKLLTFKKEEETKSA